MKICNLPYYAKFVFFCDDGACYSTADVNMLELIKAPDSDKRVYSFEVGNKITFEPHHKKVYRITSIAIKHLHDDTDMMRLGFDSEDCASMQGETKEWLFKVLINAALE